MHPADNPATDPFKTLRNTEGILDTTFQGSQVPMLLTYKGVRLAAGDWKTFSNDAPFRVPIPSEESVRSVRQLPIETDPPLHSEYREIVEPFFRGPKDPVMAAQLQELVRAQLQEAMALSSVEIVHDFALPLQSKALACLLRVPPAEANEWISWGTHVFKEGDGQAKGAALEDYLNRRFDQALKEPGADFFSALTQAKFQGRLLTREELLGFANLTFAGGRDTVIQTIASIIGFLGQHTGLLGRLKADPALVPTAAEEFFRYLSPLTHIGRVCPVKTEVHGREVEAGERVSLCWASANRDETVFPSADELRIERKPNPHLAFGVGQHNCLGALHTRVLTRALLHELADKVRCIEIMDTDAATEKEEAYERRVGYRRLVVHFHPLQ